MYIYTSIIALISLISILTYRHVSLAKGKQYYDQDGLAEFSLNTRELVSYMRRLYRFAKKILVQYSFHFTVRMLYYIRLFWDNTYTWSRNRFMKAAVKDKKAVSRFWETLKEYKQEIDEENKK